MRSDIRGGGGAPATKESRPNGGGSSGSAGDGGASADRGRQATLEGQAGSTIVGIESAGGAAVSIDPQSGPRPPRYQLLDILRGLAILAMIVFHLGWDLYYFGYSSVDVTTAWGWVIFQKSILTSFLLLVGAGLVLGHGKGIRWRRFWRRFALLVGAALLVSIGTYIQFPDYFVFFGVLHAIALFSLLGLAFLRLPPLLVAVLGLAVIAANFAYNDPVFSSRALGWIGFWPVSPETTDIVPVFPWFGVVLLGIAGMRLVLASPFAERLAAFHSGEPLARGLAFVGRWSLLIYLVHQPLLVGGFELARLVQPAPVMPAVESVSEGFVRSCNASCAGTGGTAEYCTRYCACALEQVDAANLWDDLAATEPTPAQLAGVSEVARLCTVKTGQQPAP